MSKKVIFSIKGEISKRDISPDAQTVISPAAQSQPASKGSAVWAKDGSGVELIKKERQEQLTKHGRTVEKDMELNRGGQLIEAVKQLINPEPQDQLAKSFSRLTGSRVVSFTTPEGWNENIFSKMIGKPYIERLVIAGALIAAEIDRLQPESKPDESGVQGEGHPEDTCELCGNPNPYWICGNELFNVVNGSPNGILCPSCFAIKAKAKGIYIYFQADRQDDVPESVSLLKQANDILRSVYSIIERKGEKTNWEAADRIVKMTLEKQHKYLLPGNLAKNLSENRIGGQDAGQDEGKNDVDDDWGDDYDDDEDYNDKDDDEDNDPNDSRNL